MSGNLGLRPKPEEEELTKWLGCAESLAQAIELMRKEGSGSYFVFSQQTGHKNFYQVGAEGVVSQVDDSATA